MAVIVAVPAALAVTSPVPLTVAIVVELLVQVTVLPERAFPAESRGVAVSWTVCPMYRVTLVGLTSTEATGACPPVTVIAAEPVSPSTVAVIVALPTPVAVASPATLTVATEALPLLHATFRPLRAFPAESRGVAVNWTVSPMPRLTLLGVTLTEATGATETTIVPDPLLPSTVAVTVVVPVPMAVTNPPEVTVATASSLLDHEIVRPVSAVPAESRGVAVNWTVSSTRAVTFEGATVTEATGTMLTKIAAVALWPSTVTVIVAVPVALPVTMPSALTVATHALLLCQVATRPLSKFPSASRAVTVNCAVCPT